MKITYGFSLFLQERVYNGRLDPCGAVHITIGDGGNREGLAHRYHSTTTVHVPLNLSNSSITIGMLICFLTASGIAIRSQLGRSSGKRALGMASWRSWTPPMPTGPGTGMTTRSPWELMTCGSTLLLVQGASWKVAVSWGRSSCLLDATQYSLV